MTLLLASADIEQLFDLDVARASQAEAFRRLARGEAQQTPKTFSEPTSAGMRTVTFVGSCQPWEGTVIKVVGIAEGNAARGLPTIHGIVIVLDPITGEIVAVLDGTSITTLRTAAGSAVAAEALAPSDARRLAILGAGVQGLAHARSISRVRSLERIDVWSRTAAHRDALVEVLAAELDLQVSASETAQDAISEADIVACCTSEEADPVVEGRLLKAGTLVITVGSTLLSRPEVDTATLERAAIVVDDASHAIGDYPYSALGDVLEGTSEARRSPQDIVLYISGGLPIQDAAAAWTIVNQARASTHVGQSIDFSAVQ